MNEGIYFSWQYTHNRQSRHVQRDLWEGEERGGKYQVGYQSVPGPASFLLVLNHRLERDVPLHALEQLIGLTRVP